MAVIITDGFDMYASTSSGTIGMATKWTQNTASGAQSLVTGRFGGQAVRYTNNNIAGDGLNSQRSVGSLNSFACGLAFRFPTMPTAASANYFTPLTFWNSTTTQWGICVRSNGDLEVYRMTSTSAGTLLGSAAGVVAVNTWYHLGVECTMSNTVGTITIYLDGTAIITLTGIDNVNAAGTQVTVVRIGMTKQSGNNVTDKGTVDVDDFYFCDTSTWEGERKIETLRPTADTAQKQWTPLSGTDNYAMVDETVVDGDTTYNQASSVGDFDLYNIADLSSNPAQISCINVISFGLKTDAATRAIYNSIKSGATTNDGSSFNLGSSYGKYERILAQDPNTSAAWTYTNINALQIGPKVAT